MNKLVSTAVLLMGLILAVRALKAQMLDGVPVDSWYRNSGKTFREFSPQLSFRVRKIFVPLAIEELSKAAFKSISIGEAETRVGNRIRVSKTLKPYLVRGLYVNDRTGGFILMRSGNDLMITHVGLGKSAPMERQPLVVFLLWKPTQVYTVASTDI